VFVLSPITIDNKYTVAASSATMKHSRTPQEKRDSTESKLFWCPSDTANPFKDTSVARFQKEARIHLFATYLTSTAQTS
jgi:hypothetical protein